jgi:hypothetical protein
MRTIVELLIVCVAVIGVSAAVLAFARGAGNPPHAGRTVADPDGPEWLSLEETAAYLAADSGYVLNLVSRDAIPYFVLESGNAAENSSLYFNREELDGWIVS